MRIYPRMPKPYLITLVLLAVTMLILAYPGEINWRNPGWIYCKCSSAGTCEHFWGFEENECSTDADCKRNSHKECKNTYCRTIEEEGEDSCGADSDCGHQECSVTECQRIPGPGADACLNNSDCGHKECVSRGYCSSVPGAGENRCAADTDCGHHECEQDGSCNQVPGAGPDTCSHSSECGHMACDGWGGYCRRVGGVGKDECEDHPDCNHLECQDGFCLGTSGGGSNSCRENSDCGHRECNSRGYCEYAGGIGPDLCDSNEECGHKECNPSSGYCEQVQNSGPNLCDSNSDCGHYECVGAGCVFVPGAGQSQCNPYNPDSDCSHKECNSDGACVAFLGEGLDRCAVPSHCGRNICQNGICTRIPEIGINECLRDSDCAQRFDSGSSGDAESKDTITLSQPSYASYSGIGSTQYIGDSSASVSIEMFQDLRCGMCSYAFHSLLPVVVERYIISGKARLQIYEFPLIARDLELTLAKAAKCSAKQGRYFQALSWIYNLGADTTKAALDSFAAEVGIDGEELMSCMQSSQTSVELERDRSRGKALGVKGTPTFFVNGEKVTGARLDPLLDAIERALK